MSLMIVTIWHYLIVNDAIFRDHVIFLSVLWVMCQLICIDFAWDRTTEVEAITPPIGWTDAVSCQVTIKNQERYVVSHQESGQITFIHKPKSAFVSFCCSKPPHEMTNPVFYTRKKEWNVVIVWPEFGSASNEKPPHLLDVAPIPSGHQEVVNLLLTAPQPTPKPTGSIGWHPPAVWLRLEDLNFTKETFFRLVSPDCPKNTNHLTWWLKVESISGLSCRCLYKPTFQLR